MSGMRIVLTILAAFIQLMALSQGIVRGRVTDQEGETLIGANIVIKDEPVSYTHLTLPTSDLV